MSTLYGGGGREARGAGASGGGRTPEADRQIRERPYAPRKQTCKFASGRTHPGSRPANSRAAVGPRAWAVAQSIYIYSIHSTSRAPPRGLARRGAPPRAAGPARLRARRSRYLARPACAALPPLARAAPRSPAGCERSAAALRSGARPRLLARPARGARRTQASARARRHPPGAAAPRAERGSPPAAAPAVRAAALWPRAKVQIATGAI